MCRASEFSLRPRIRALAYTLAVLNAADAQADVTVLFGFGPLRNISGDVVATGSMWGLVVAAPGSQLPGGLDQNSTLSTSDVQVLRDDFGGALMAPGSQIGGARVVATGSINSEGFVERITQLTNADYQSIQAGGLIGLYWFPGVIGQTATLPESDFEIGGMQETSVDPESGGNAGMVVPSNSGQSIIIAYFDSDTTGSPSSLPADRFTAINVPASGYLVWRDLTFTESQIGAGDGDPEADPDRDGLVNLLEYATSSLPLTGSPGPLGLRREGASVELQFDRIAGSELRYRVEATDDLGISPWPDVVFESSGAANTEGLVEFGLPLAPGKRFFRLRVDFVEDVE